MSQERRKPQVIHHAMPVVKGPHAYDTADTLTNPNILWLSVTLGLVAAPHILRLPVWIGALSLLILCWRLYASRHARAMPAKWMLVFLGILGAIGIYASFGMIFGRDSGVALLVLMLFLKLMETHSKRDVTVVICLSYFLILTNFLYSQTMPTAAYLLLMLWIVTATLVSFNHHSIHIPAISKLKTGGLLILQALPLMLILFLFFPRIQGPLWGLPQPGEAGRTGLSEKMSPGSISDLSASGAAAFRVDFDGPIPPQKQLYWRGLVLSDFDGKTWTIGGYSSGKVSYQSLTTPIKYNVTLEPHNRRWLFALDLPALVPPDAAVFSNFQLLARRPVESRLRYEMQSILNYRTSLSPDAMELRRALQLPLASNPKTRELALTMRRKAQSDFALVEEVLRMFRNEGYSYTLQPPLLGADPVDDFLFNTRRGFCEHYASSFTFLMRAAGIPARVVTGYQGGEINPVGNYLLVRQADAHAWSEVWLADKGWIRVDPTNAVAPSRVDTGIQAAVPAGDPLPFNVRQEAGWLKNLRLNWDATTYNWNKWVLGYNTQRQLEFLTNLGIKDATWQSLIAGLSISGGLFMLLLIGFLLWRLKPENQDQVQMAWVLFCSRLGKRGLARLPNEGPKDYAARIGNRLPTLASRVQHISELYIRLRYGSQNDSAAIRHFTKLVREFKA